MSIEEIEQLKVQMASMQEVVGNCQINVYNRLNLHDEKFSDIEDQFENQTKERNTHSNRMNLKLDKIALQTERNMTQFDMHTKEEMSKYDTMIESLNELTNALKSVIHDTGVNTDFIDDLKKRWFTYSIRASTVGTVVFLGYSVYMFLQKNGYVFIIEKAGS